MSLINKALKKAQHERTGTPTSASVGAGSEEAAPIPQYNQMPPPKNDNFKLFAGLIVAAVLIIGLLICIFGFLLMTNLKPKESPQLAEDTTLSQADVAKTSKPAAAPVGAGATAAELQATEEAAERAAKEQAAAELAAAQAAELAAKEAELAAAQAEIERLAQAEKQSEQDKIIQWLSKARVGGVRISANGSKVLLNNKAYLEGETVNDALGLTVVVIEEKRILFEDGSGKRYKKSL